MWYSKPIYNSVSIFLIKIWSSPIHHILYILVSIQAGFKFTIHYHLISHSIQWRWLSDLFFTIVNIHITIKNMKISSCSKTLNKSDRSSLILILYSCDQLLCFFYQKILCPIDISNKICKVGIMDIRIVSDLVWTKILRYKIKFHF